MTGNEMYSDDDVLSVGDIADLYGINPSTVRSWKRRGKLGPEDGMKPMGWKRETVERVVREMKGKGDE